MMVAILNVILVHCIYVPQADLVHLGYFLDEVVDFCFVDEP